MNESTTICTVCDLNAAIFLSEFRPYIDMNWIFKIFECQNCGVRFSTRDPSTNYHEILHKTLGGGYSRHYDIADKVKYLLNKGSLNKCEKYLRDTSSVYAELIDFIKKQKSKTLNILEIGCSTGFITAFFQSQGYEIEGIDISESSIEYARSTFGPFYFIEHNKEHYDLIFHLGLIGCVDNPKSFLSNYLKLLKPNGVMFFNSPNIKSLKQRDRLWASTPPPDLIYIFSEKSFHHMVNSSYDVKCIKKHVQSSGSILNQIKKIRGIRPNRYPRVFQNSYSKNQKQNMSTIKKNIKKYITSAYKFTSKLPINRKYDSEYGLFFTIKRIH